ncbi:MAG: DUF1189 family protein [Lachnospiraceae bacterium]|nr:DUF1189 family protein [Lachnospiraceae bacterium]
MYQEKINPFMQIPTSFAGFAKQKLFIKLREQSTGSKMVYAIIMAILLSFISFFVVGLKLANDKELAKALNEMPNFSYADGELNVDTTANFASSGTVFFMDTNVEAFYNGTNDTGFSNAQDIQGILATMNIQEPVQQAMFLAKKNFVFINYTTNQNLPPQEYSKIMPTVGITSFDKQTVLNGYKSVIIKVFAIISGIMVIILFIHLFLITLIWSLIGLIVNGVAKADADFSDIYWISFYINGAFCIVKYVLKLFISWKFLLTCVLIGTYIGILYLALKSADEETPSNYIPTGPSVDPYMPQSGSGDSTNNPF